MARYKVAGILILLAANAVYAADATIINAGATFPEGPVVVDGKLLFAEYGAHRVTQWDGKTNATLWSQDDCGPSAVVPMGPDFAITCYDSGQLVVISADGTTKASFNADAAGEALIGPNDGTPDGRDGIYFTTSGPWESGPIVGKILHLSADGTLTTMADDLHYANGIALSADGTLVYVNESEAGRVITFKVGDDGSLSDRRLFVRLTALDEPDGAYPDGIKLGPDGNLYIGQYSSGRILVVNQEGSLVRKIEVPSPAAPNLTFSANGATIYVMGVDDTANPPYKGTVYSVPNE
jgi:sugar lactone lactonase YvrE